MSLTKYTATCGVCKTDMNFDAEDIPRLVLLDGNGRGPEVFCPLGHSQHFDAKIAVEAVKWVRAYYSHIARDVWDKPQPVKRPRRGSTWRSEEKVQEAVKVEVEKAQPESWDEAEARVKKVLTRLDDFLARRGEFAPEPAAESIGAAIEEEVKKR